MNTKKLSKEVLSKAWESNSLENLGGWMELANIDPSQVFRTRNIKDHEYIGKKVFLKELEEAGYNSVGIVINCLIHPKGRLLFDVDFRQPTPDFFINSQGVNLLTHRKPDCEIHRVFINELQEHFMEVLE